MFVITSNYQRKSGVGSDPYFSASNWLQKQGSEAFVLLQEVGAVTGGGQGGRAKEIGSGITLIDGIALGISVYKITHRSQNDIWVVFFDISQVKQGGNSLNLAIVSNSEPDILDSTKKIYNVGVLFGAFPRWRPVLWGIWTIGGQRMMFASIHAYSPNGNDAKVLVDSTAAMGSNINHNMQLVIGGDFNKEPNSWSLPAGSLPPGFRVVNSGENTYDVNIKGGPKNEYDYFITNASLKANENIEIIRSKSGSDHYPVEWEYS